MTDLQLAALLESYVRLLGHIINDMAEELPDEAFETKHPGTLQEYRYAPALTELMRFKDSLQDEIAILRGE